MNASRSAVKPHRLTQSLVARHLQEDQGQLALEGCRLTDLATAYGTPLYVYGQRIMQHSWDSLRRAFPDAFQIYYSIKANPNQFILKHLLKQGCGMEIASGGELQLALAAGCAPSDLIYAGPGKTDAELALAIEKGLAEIHAESMGEVQRIAQVAQRLATTARVALRVNPNLETVAGSLQMGGRPSPFGMDEDQLSDVMAAADAQPWLELLGLHLNTGTQILDAATLLEYYRHALALARQAARQLDRPLRTLDFGGGLGIPYYEGQAALDMDLLHPGLVELVQACRTDPLLSPTRLMIEPGRYLVGEAGFYLMQVIDIKRSRGQTFVVADGGMHHHAAATGNFGQTLKRPFPIAVANRRLEAPDREGITLVGPLCTPLDTFGRNLPLAGLEPGDLLVVLQSGAYARTASPLQFLGHPSPAEVWVTAGRHRLVRQRGVWQDELRDQPMDDTEGD